MDGYKTPRDKLALKHIGMVQEARKPKKLSPYSRIRVIEDKELVTHWLDYVEDASSDYIGTMKYLKQIFTIGLHMTAG